MFDSLDYKVWPYKIHDSHIPNAFNDIDDHSFLINDQIPNSVDKIPKTVDDLSSLINMEVRHGPINEVPHSHVRRCTRTVTPSTCLTNYICYNVINQHNNINDFLIQLLICSSITQVKIPTFQTM